MTPVIDTEVTVTAYYSKTTSATPTPTPTPLEGFFTIIETSHAPPSSTRDFPENSLAYTIPHIFSDSETISSRKFTIQTLIQTSSTLHNDQSSVTGLDLTSLSASATSIYSSDKSSSVSIEAIIGGVIGGLIIIGIIVITIVWIVRRTRVENKLSQVDESVTVLPEILTKVIDKELPEYEHADGTTRDQSELLAMGPK